MLLYDNVHVSSGKSCPLGEDYVRQDVAATIIHCRGHVEADSRGIGQSEDDRDREFVLTCITEFF